MTSEVHTYQKWNFYYTLTQYIHIIYIDYVLEVQLGYNTRRIYIY